MRWYLHVISFGQAYQASRLLGERFDGVWRAYWVVEGVHMAQRDSGQVVISAFGHVGSERPAPVLRFEGFGVSHLLRRRCSTGGEELTSLQISKFEVSSSPWIHR